MFLKNRNISSKIKRSKVTDCAALNPIIVDSLFIVAHIVCDFLCVWSLFSYIVISVLSSFTVILLRMAEIFD